MTARFSEGDPAYEWIILFLVYIPVLNPCPPFDYLGFADGEERVAPFSRFLGQFQNICA